MRDRAVAAAGDLLRSAVSSRVFPAAVAEVGSRREVLWGEACGTLTFDDDAPAARHDTVFDLASLTKPLATATVALQLADAGTLPLSEPAAAIFPEWTGDDRRLVTIRDLLEHTGGLGARLLDHPPTEVRAFEHEICTMPLEYPPRTRALYSDLGFILLGMACERRGGARFAELVAAVLRAAAQGGGCEGGAGELLVAVPESMHDRTAPTVPLSDDPRRGRRLRGEVHDNYAAALGGFAGHAGLFGTASGVGAFARVVLKAAHGDATLPSPFTPSAIALATTKSGVPGSSRALGWDTMLPTSSCGTQLSSAAVGHVGFTGTSLWIDPPRDRYYVLLTNRVCDGGTSEEMQAVRRAFHDRVAPL